MVNFLRKKIEVIVPSGVGLGFLDSKAGPRKDLSGGEVFDLDWGCDDADEVYGVAEILLPLNFSGSCVLRAPSESIVIVAVIG